MKLIITTINRGTILLDTESEEYKVLFDTLIGALGICEYPDGYLLGDRKGKVYKLDADLNLSGILVDDPAMPNIHDMLVHDEVLYLVDSSTNTIRKYNIATGEYLDSICLFNNTSEDIHHFNSLKMHKGKFYLSMFFFDIESLAVANTIGRLDEVDMDAEATHEGYKFKKPTGAIICFDPQKHIVESLVANGLYHPHSLHFHNDQLYYAESLMEQVVEVTHNPILKTGSYTRGLEMTEDKIFVGRNAYRNHVGSNPDDLSARLIIADWDGDIEREIVLDGFTEIYDILIKEKSL